MLKINVINSDNLKKSKDMFLQSMFLMHTNFPIPREPAKPSIPKPSIPKPSSNANDSLYHQDWLNYHSEMIVLNEEYQKELASFSEKKKEAKRLKALEKDKIIRRLINNLFDDANDYKFDTETISRFRSNMSQHFVENHYSDEEIFDETYEGIKILCLLNGY